MNVPRPSKKILALVCFIWSFWFFLKFVPGASLYPELGGSRVLLDRYGDLLSISLTDDDKYRVKSSYSEFSEEVINATLAYEDSYYFFHYGFNPVSLIRAAAQTLITPKRPIGASTITMQLARMRTGKSTRSIWGKINQIFQAILFERKFTKQQILEAYLNQAPYGGNVEGITAASFVYFRKKASLLTYDEAVSLVVIPQHPAVRWKSDRDDLNVVKERLARRLIKEYSVTSIIPRPLMFTVSQIPKMAPHFFTKLEMSYPETTVFESTLDPNMQLISEQVLRSTLKLYSDQGVRNGSVLIAELDSMKVRSYVGSASYLSSDISGFVNGLAAKRSPGSLLKPFIYALGIDQGKIIPETTLFDVPIRLSSYRPENFERNFLGPISAHDALIRSRNIPALELFRKLEVGSFYDYLKQSGVADLKNDDYYGIALVLGGLGTTSEEIAELYGVLGNLGEYEKLSFFENQKMLDSKRRRVLSKESSYLVLNMLADNPPAININRLQNIPWKTGTSYGSRDAWSAGIVGPYVVVVWLGEFDGRSNPNLVGRDFAGPILFSIADRLNIFSSTSPSIRPQDLNLKKIEVCALTGQPPSKDCPHRKTSWFIPGVSPVKVCAVHRKFVVDEVSGLRLCPGDNSGKSKVYELWDSSLQTLFSRAGLKRMLPPPFDPRCGLGGDNLGEVRIVSPESYIEYFIEPHRDLEIEFLASMPGDSREVFWFVDESMVGSGEPGKPIYWKAKAGAFIVKVVDDHGRAREVRIRVKTVAES